MSVRLSFHVVKFVQIENPQVCAAFAKSRIQIDDEIDVKTISNLNCKMAELLASDENHIDNKKKLII